MTDFIKVELNSFQDICERIEELESQRTLLCEHLSEFANEVKEGWKCGDGHFESTPFEKSNHHYGDDECENCTYFWEGV